MSNEFSTRKNRQVSKKFNLVRMNPARYINDDLSGPASGIYSVTLSGYAISDVQLNGVSLIEVSTTPVSGQWYHNETSGVLQIYPASAPSASSAIVVFYYLFYTQSDAVYYHEDPEDTDTTVRYWEPKLDSDISVSVNAEDIINGGILSTDINSVSLINNNYDFNKYLTPNDSFYNKDIMIWICLDSAEHIQKIFKGSIKGVILNRDQVSLQVENIFTILDQPATLDVSAQYTYWNLSDFPNLDPNRDGTPIHIHFGKVTRYQLRFESVTNLTSAKQVIPSSMFEAVCTNYSESVSTSTNREWGCGRKPSTRTPSYFSGAITAVDNTDANFTVLTLSSTQIAKAFIGDTLEIETSGGALRGNYRVYYVDRTSDYLYITKDAAIVNTDTIPALIDTGGSNYVPHVTCVAIEESDGTTYYPLMGRDYFASAASFSGGGFDQRYISITFVNNFEASLSMSTLDPRTHKVTYRMNPDSTSFRHDQVLTTLLNGAGIADIDTTTFGAAGTADPVNCNFSIPYFGESDYDTYYTYIQDLLRSTFGLLALGNDYEVEYHLIAAPSSSTNITTNDFANDSMSASIEYKDIVTEIVAYNNHYASEEATANPTDSPSDSQKSIKAEHLHGIKKTIKFVHLLTDITSRLAEIIKVRSERYVLYKFDTPIANLDTVIDDDFQLSGNFILGTDTTKDVKILGTTKGTNGTKVTASDLYNLT